MQGTDLLAHAQRPRWASNARPLLLGPEAAPWAMVPIDVCAVRDQFVSILAGRHYSRTRVARDAIRKRPGTADARTVAAAG